MSSKNTSETPKKSGTYDIKIKDKTIQNISYNFDRSESVLKYHNLTSIENVSVSNSITKIFNDIKSDTKINALWKWFAIFALTK